MLTDLFGNEVLPKIDRRKERREKLEKAQQIVTEAGWRVYRLNHFMFYESIRGMALTAWKGRIKFSVRGAFYRLREEGYKVPNAFSRYCALDLIADHPELSSLITVKK